MAAIDEVFLPSGADVLPMWRSLAGQATDWLAARRVPPREAVVLVPYAALIAPARAAFAEVARTSGGGAWMPRIETPLTLAAALAPPVQRAAGSCTGEPVADGLHAAGWLRDALPAGPRGLEQLDPAGFARRAGQLADAAAALRLALLSEPPGRRRAARSVAMQAAMPAPQGPGALEAVLLAAACEWAAQSAAGDTDVLFTHHPGAWIAVQLGGADELAEAVLAAADVPALRVVADAPGDDAFAGVARPPLVRRWLCADFEAEAQATAAEVIEAIDAGRVPVGLVALDRALVRRVRALLERRGVALIDDTGWRLSTTVAGTRVAALLRAARAADGSDERLAWLKGWPAAEPEALRSLEALWRGSRFVPSAAAAERLSAACTAHLSALRSAARQPLAEWLRVLRATLSGAGHEWTRLRADAAGRQVLAALWVDDEGVPGAAAAAAERWYTDLAGFAGWVESALDAATFVPPAPAQGAAAQVVIAPLARMAGRPFAHLLVPAADERHLAPGRPSPGLVGPSEAEKLGLPTPAARTDRQRRSLAQLMRSPALTLLRRRVEGGAPLAASPDLECLWLALGASGTPAPAEVPWLPATERRATALVPRPAPSVTIEQLPATLSASRIEALRACPYRFFARTVLGLEQADELADPLSKRDYGNWLHELLLRFHRQRTVPGRTAAADAAGLHAAADAAAAYLGLGADELLPFRASFDAFVPAYLRWLHEREAAGWYWSEGETAREVAPPELAPTRLKGVIDRIDRGPGGALEVLDYKAGDIVAQRKRVREPLEDTQLAVYAALLLQDGQAGDALRAAYVALDDADGPDTVPHEEVARSAQALLRHLGEELARIRAGTPLPALGEEPCAYCEARGLCRRDHWGEPR